jgi:hypothetical protein
MAVLSSTARAPKTTSVANASEKQQPKKKETTGEDSLLDSFFSSV